MLCVSFQGLSATGRVWKKLIITKGGVCLGHVKTYLEDHEKMRWRWPAHSIKTITRWFWAEEGYGLIIPFEGVGKLVLGSALQVSQGTARGCNCTSCHGGLGGTDCIAFAFDCQVLHAQEHLALLTKPGSSWGAFLQLLCQCLNSLLVLKY